MADQYRGRTRRNDDSMIPLVTVLVVVAAVGPALFTALTQWLLPRLTAGRDAVSVGLGEWWAANSWLVLFWGLELVLLIGFLAWSRRRRSRRSRQLDSVVTGLARTMPADWEPRRDLRVLRWSGHRPVRLQVRLTPRSSLHDPGWRRSLADAARTVLGPVEPITWPRPPRNGVVNWGAHPPTIDLRVATRRVAAEVGEDLAGSDSNRTDWRLSDGWGTMDVRGSGPSSEDLQLYRRPHPESTGRVTAEHGSAPTRLDRED